MSDITGGTICSGSRTENNVGFNNVQLFKSVNEHIYGPADKLGNVKEFWDAPPIEYK